MEEIKPTTKEVKEYKITKKDIEEMICEYLKIDYKKLDKCIFKWELGSNNGAVMGAFITTEKILWE